MKTRTRRTIRLREEVQAKPRRVDREAGIIFGVRVLGLRSANGRRYLPEAARNAIPLYEGASVRIDHRKKNSVDDKPAETVFGWLRRVRQDPADGGLRADLHFLTSHPMAERVCEAAERNPGAFALSHDADGRGARDADGVFVVEEITEVRSVDIVSDGATNMSLFESRHHRGGRSVVRTRLRKLLESIARRVSGRRRRRILEAMNHLHAPGLDPGAEPVRQPSRDEMAVDEDDDDSDMSAEDKLRHGVKQACHAVIEDEDLSADEKHKQIKALLMGHENMVKGGAVGKDEDAVDEDDDQDDDATEARHWRRLPRDGKGFAETLRESSAAGRRSTSSRPLRESGPRVPSGVTRHIADGKGFARFIRRV